MKKKQWRSKRKLSSTPRSGLNGQRAAASRSTEAWQIVHRVADRHVGRFSRTLQAAMSGDRVSEDALERAYRRRDPFALERIALAGLDSDVLTAATAATTRLLAQKQTLEEMLMDTMEESANATRCLDRP